MCRSRSLSQVTPKGIIKKAVPPIERGLASAIRLGSIVDQFLVVQGAIASTKDVDRLARSWYSSAHVHPWAIIYPC